MATLENAVKLKGLLGELWYLHILVYTYSVYDTIYQEQQFLILQGTISQF